MDVHGSVPVQCSVSKTRAQITRSILWRHRKSEHWVLAQMYALIFSSRSAADIPPT